MTEANDARQDTVKKENVALAQIQPIKVEKNSPESEKLATEKLPTNERSESLRVSEVELSLIRAIILLLRNHGIRKSGAAIRDAVDISHHYIGPKEAVSALSSLGFKASFGRLNIKSLTEEFFPLIAFKKNSEAFIIYDAPLDGRIFTTNPATNEKDEISKYLDDNKVQKKIYVPNKIINFILK